MKFGTCCCPNAKYFIKADVDSYLRLKNLDESLDRLQQKADLKLPQLKVPAFYGKSWESHVPIHTGIKQYWLPLYDYNASQDRPVSDRYPRDFFMGALEIFSMPLTKQLVQYCPKHCFGYYDFRKPIDFSKTCRGVRMPGEDRFIGSCVFSIFRHSIHFERIHWGETMAMVENNFSIFLNYKHPEQHVLAGQINTKNLMQQIHDFYLNLDEKQLNNQKTTK